MKNRRSPGWDSPSRQIGLQVGVPRIPGIVPPLQALIREQWHPNERNLNKPASLCVKF